jgi:hypothetical protein
MYVQVFEEQHINLLDCDEVRIKPATADKDSAWVIFFHMRNGEIRKSACNWDKKKTAVDIVKKWLGEFNTFYSLSRGKK